MKIIKKNFISLLLLLYGLLFLFCYILSSTVFFRSNFLIITTFLFNGAIWVVLLLNELKKNPYSMKSIHWIFCLFFYFLAAIVQYGNDSFPWVGNRSDDIILKSNLLLFIWTLSYLIGTKIKINGKGKVIQYLQSDYEPSPTSIKIMSLVSMLVLISRISKTGLTGIFKKSVIQDTISYGSSSALTNLMDHVLVATCCFTALISIYSAKRNSNYRKYAFINTATLIIAFFPPVLSRYAVATIYGSLLLITFPSLRKGRKFIFGFIIAFLLIFPMMEGFRRNDFGEFDIINGILSAIRNMSNCWTQGHYDAFTTYSLTIEKVELEGITYGRQLLGVLLFFIPRSVWPNKPIGTGAYMATDLGTFTNISCPPPGEGYINFGILGLLIFGVIFGTISEWLDNLYWKNDNNLRLNTLYPVVMFMFFFMCRGDLMSTFAYLSSYIIVWLIMTSNISFIRNKC